MVEAVLSKKKGAGQGSGKAGPARKPTLDKAQALLGRLATPVVTALIPVFEKYALPKTCFAAESSGPTIDFPTFAEHMETLDNMLSGGDPIEAPNCAELGAFISNRGTKEEIAEVMLTLLSVGKRVFLRYDAARDAAWGTRARR